MKTTNTPHRGLIDADSITDTSTNIVYKVTGPCSMSSPCPGDSCPEHGKPAPVVTVEPALWRVTADGEPVGDIVLGSVRFYAYLGDPQRTVGSFDTQAEAVAALIAESKRDPDAEMVEAMADALARRNEWDGLHDPHIGDPQSFREDARAVLAAQREAVHS